MKIGILRRPGAEIVCITALFHMIWGAHFGGFPTFTRFSWNPLISMKSTLNHKNVYFAVLVRNSMIYPKRACGYLWIRLYIVRSTASVAKGTTLGHGNQKFHQFYEFSWFSWNSWFYGKVWNSRKIHPKATFRARGKSSSNSYAFLHGSEAVRVLWEPEWWNSLIFTRFSRIPPFLVKCGEVWWFFGVWGMGIWIYTK